MQMTPREILENQAGLTPEPRVPISTALSSLAKWMESEKWDDYRYCKQGTLEEMDKELIIHNSAIDHLIKKLNSN